MRIARDLFPAYVPGLYVPAHIADDCENALDNCLNRTHAKAKRIQFHSFRSEDHPTWTAMPHLQHEPSLSQAFKHPGMEPVLLMSGVPVPNNSPQGWRSVIGSSVS